VYFQIQALPQGEGGAVDGRVITSVPEFHRVMDLLEQQPLVAVDYETSGTKWYQNARPVGVALGAPISGKYEAFYCPFGHWTHEPQLPEGVVVQRLGRILGSERQAKMAWNLIFERHMSRQLGLEIRGPCRDGMVEAHLHNENESKALKERGKIDLRDESSADLDKLLDKHVERAAKLHRVNKTTFLDQFGYAPLPVAVVGPYAVQDILLTLRLGGFYDVQDIRGRYASIYETEIDLTEVVTDMEREGMPLSRAYLGSLHDRLSADQKLLEQRIFAECGTFRIGSADELRWILQNILRLDWTKLTPASVKAQRDARGQLSFRDYERWVKQEWNPILSVDDEVLSALAPHSPVCKLIADWRVAETLKTRYTWNLLDYCDRSDVLHGQFQPLGTNTGRLSSKNPNMQNASSDDDDRAVAFSGKKLEDGGIDPWSVKRAFIIPEGCIRGYFDYSQIELRVLAEVSADPVMLDVYANNEDIHKRTAKEVFGSTEKKFRRPAKIINFGLSYCMGDAGFARQAGIPLEEATRFLAIFFEKYPRIAPFRREFWDRIQRDQGYFENVFGRPRRIPDICQLAQVWLMRRAQRQSIGSLVQGTAAELTKCSLVRIHKLEKKLRAGIRICSTIHDEIQINFPKNRDTLALARLVKSQMEAYGDKFRKVAIVAGAEQSETTWADKTEWHLA
jgi:DNA polymerase-1